MSRTRRRAPHSIFRRPRDNGARRAVMETLDGNLLPAVRPRAIPPDAWDDLRFSREADGAVARYMLNAWRDGCGFRHIVRRATRRFGLTYRAAFALLASIARCAA